jgi:cold-inducible RNA-binding protein
MGNKLYVGNLPYSFRDEDLQQAFAAYGSVSSAKVMMERDTGRSKGFGFVEMGSDAEAQAAIGGMNGQQFGGRGLVVNEARPMEARPPRTGGGGFGGGAGGGRSGGGGYGGGGGGGTVVAPAAAAVVAAAVVVVTAVAATATKHRLGINPNQKGPSGPFLLSHSTQSGEGFHWWPITLHWRAACVGGQTGLCQTTSLVTSASPWLPIPFATESRGNWHQPQSP